MKKITLIIAIILAIPALALAQSPGGKSFGFGIILGEPTGGTLKFWTQRNNAFVVDIGASYFGSPRIGVDYLWHFNAFNSGNANLYAGAGGVLGIGEGDAVVYYRNGKLARTGNDAGLAARGVFGVNFIPERTPLELFAEFGLLVAVVPDFGTAADVAIGMRFYP